MTTPAAPETSGTTPQADAFDQAEGYSPQISVHAAGRHWQLSRAANLEELWEAMTSNPDDFEDERLPYWTELWPSSVALAGWLAQNKAALAGQRCLDLGCGLGLTAMVGSWLGARVTAMDYEPEALHFAALNARINAVPQPHWLVMDWRRPALRPGCMQFIWGGDIMYEKRFVAPVLHFLEHCLAPGGRAWVAEPGRSIYEFFLHALHRGGWQGQRVYSTRVEALYAQPVPVTVQVWELRRRADLT